MVEFQNRIFFDSRHLSYFPNYWPDPKPFQTLQSSLFRSEQYWNKIGECDVTPVNVYYER
jgi:hypothetical protein